MGRSPDDVFKKFDKNEVFVIGSTPEERVELLYIRQGMPPYKIFDRLKTWGDEISIQRIRSIIKNKSLKKKRQDFKNAYDLELHKARAVKAATKDVSDETEVREVYAQVSGDIINSIKQKLLLSTTPDSSIPQMSVQDLASLSMSLEVTQKVHFKSLGIPELIKIDPTGTFEGITIIPGDETQTVDGGDDE